MILITIQYIPIDFEVAFLRIKTVEIALKHYQYAFFCHVYSSIFVLIAGVTQFSNWLRTRFSVLHRFLGKFYVLLILMLASPSGLVMGYYANGGLNTQISFCLLAIFWFVFTYLAYSSAKKKEWQMHQNYMLRSYALTLSAISLRLFKWLIVSFYPLPPNDTYQIVAWAGWLINWLLVEMYLFIKKESLFDINPT